MTGFKMKHIITKQYLTPKSKRRSGAKAHKIRFVVAHDTGNSGSTASNNVSYYERSRNDMSASAHIFIDDINIIECIPALTGTPEKAWHVLYDRPLDNKMFGVDANDGAIGVELCFGGKVDNRKAYEKYVWVIAYICHKFGLDPKKDIVGHYLLDPGRKSDPLTAFRLIGKTFEGFILDVENELKDCTSGKGEITLELTNYQWSVLEKNVKKLLDKGIIGNQDWLTKVQKKSLTVSELAWLNSVVLDRQIK